MADKLATRDDLAALLQQDVVEATADLMLEAATAAVQGIVGQRIVRATSTVSLDVSDDRWLWLPQRPVVSVASVMMDDVELDTTDWSLRGHRLYRQWGWWGLVGAPVEVTYTHGYADGDQRLQLARAAVLSLAAAAYSNPAGVSREQIDDYAVAYETGSAGMQVPALLRQTLLREYGRPAGVIPVGQVLL
ncbi:MAG TPA: hypothetical protein VFX60_19375 [Micromonospora sp.]|nr:hypothetical protein [Micromonospora sp.]